MSALMDQTKVLAAVSPSKPAVTTDDRDLALGHLRTHYPEARIKFLYGCRDSYFFRVNRYSADESYIARSDFVVVRVDGPAVDHEIRTLGTEN